MNILFTDANIINKGRVNLAVTDEFIRYIGADIPEGRFDRIIDCRGGLLLPGLYNCHTHAAMTLFRGYGEDMPLKEWLDTRILPAEDHLTNHSVYAASMLACAEMIRNGIVSFSDMYFFCDRTVRAVGEVGMKANLSRSIVSFDPDADCKADRRYLEATRLFADYNNSYCGRVKIDMALHAEYTNVPEMVQTVADYSARTGARMQLHLSETEREHKKCIDKNGVTPAIFFADNGAFDVPATAAHCVWASDDDIDLFREKGVTVAHNPASNLKLGSGVMPLSKMLENGVNVTLGTDGAASNNNLNIFREMYLAAILQKGINRDPSQIKAADVIKAATVNGAVSQGRYDSGRLETGCRADIILLDLDAVNNIPVYDLSYAAVYSADASNVRVTMCDGKILYEDGDYKTLDIEKVKSEMKDAVAHYFD